MLADVLNLHENPEDGGHSAACSVSSLALLSSSTKVGGGELVGRVPHCVHLSLLDSPTTTGANQTDALHGHHLARTIERPARAELPGESNDHHTAMSTGGRSASSTSTAPAAPSQPLVHPCPRCETATLKEGGCDTIKCPVCKRKWCWLCSRIVGRKPGMCRAPSRCNDS